MADASTLPIIEPPTVRRDRRTILGRWLILVVIVGGCIGIAAAWLLCFGPDASYRRGRAALITGDRDTVVRESDRLIRISGYATHGWFLKGLLLSRLGKPDEAISCLRNSMTNESFAVEANTVSAEIYYQSGLYLQAIDAAEEALRRDNGCLQARRWLAGAYYDLGALSHAVAELEQISTQAPNDPRPTRLLGLIAKDGEHYAKAIDYYHESLRRDPEQADSTKILIELAESQIKLKRFEDAMVTLKKCERSAAVLTLKADCHSSLGQFDKAHDLLREAAEVDPTYFQAKMSQGKLFLDQGQVEDAVRSLTEAVRLEPHVSQGHFQLSQALRRAGNAEQADEELRQMQEIQTLEREFTDSHEAASSQPNDAEIRYRTGQLALRLGKPKLAQIWFRAALAIDPKHARARAAISQ